MQNLSPQELSRLHRMSFWEHHFKSAGFVRIAGIDEAGRGPLAGPVVAAACILPEGALFEHLNDSKQLSAAQRELLYSQITSFPLVEFGLGMVDAAAIDQINILQATFAAMRQAVANLSLPPDYLLIDGHQIPAFKIPSKALIKGDSLSLSIAAASILAKVTRDRIMEQYDAQWPDYGFKKHKGYGTKQHLEALKKNGPTPIHRLSFAPISLALSSNLP
jgi:ribonuclease HII